MCLPQERLPVLSFPSKPPLPPPIPAPQLKAANLLWVTIVGTGIRDGATLVHLFPWAAVPGLTRNHFSLFCCLPWGACSEIQGLAWDVSFWPSHVLLQSSKNSQNWVFPALGWYKSSKGPHLVCRVP